MGRRAKGGRGFDSQEKQRRAREDKVEAVAMQDGINTSKNSGICTHTYTHMHTNKETESLE